ncbi:hypothetical protein [Rhizobium sp. Leaf341]|uniref:hypothetical protein n=1 Tax=Rhizobium sp. Leaf341 TaxID=1736344 RepID=UPI0012E332D2|nr:hypothetical protein [Rhizobium sp. Leaf341]
MITPNTSALSVHQECNKAQQQLHNTQNNNYQHRDRLSGAPWVEANGLFHDPLLSFGMLRKVPHALR